MNKKPVSYLQTDPRWKNIDYSAKSGESKKRTIGSSGCGPTCAAMLIETITGKTFTPADACSWSLQRGYKAPNQGTYYSYFAPQFKAFGITCQQLNGNNVYGKPSDPVHKKAFDLLKQGYYLIACMGKGLWTTSGHFVVVWWQDGKVRINDPNSTASSRVNGDYSLFSNQVKYYWAIDARTFNSEEDDDMIYYKTINDVPAGYKPSVQKAINAGALKGAGGGVINVSEDMCRTLTILDRMGVLKTSTVERLTK